MRAGYLQPALQKIVVIGGVEIYILYHNFITCK